MRQRRASTETVALALAQEMRLHDFVTSPTGRGDRCKRIGFAVALAFCLLCFDSARSAERVSIEAVLAEAVSVKFEATPLDEVLKKFSTNFHLPIVIDRHALEAGGLELHELKVTYEAHETSLENALHDILAPHQLEVMIRNDVAWITTRAANYFDTRVYKVTRRVPVERRMRSILGTVEPGSWTTAGGQGDIASVPPNLLLVYQSPRLHRQITKTFSDSIVPIRADKADTAQQHAGIEKQLDLPANIDFQGVRFVDAMEQLAKQHSFPISIDETTIGFSGIALEEATVTLQLDEVRRLSSALSLVLEVVSQDLEWIVEGDAITITTADAAAESLIPVTYGVQGLITDGDAMPLIEAIQYTVATASWEIRGGNGTISAGDEDVTLEVVQSYPVHRTLRRLLADLRTGNVQEDEGQQ